MRYSPRNIRIACDHAGLTHYGGVHLFHEFLRVLQFRDYLATHMTYPRRNNRYHLSQMILALMYPIVLGLDRLETASFLRSNGTFQYLTGLPSFPDPQTLRRFLIHAPDAFWQQLHRVNDRLLQKFIHLPTRRSRLVTVQVVRAAGAEKVRPPDGGGNVLHRRGSPARGAAAVCRFA